MKKMLLVFAHPDDESFSVGGTVAKYAKAGWDIRLICATNGEKGDTGAIKVSEEQETGEIRKKELENAAKILGISSITFLEQSDGKLKMCSPGTLEDPIYASMLEFLPDVVITYDTTGISNHPDHIKMCYATTYAFQKYAAYLESLKKQEDVDKGRGKIWKQVEYNRAFSNVNPELHEPLLYYVCIPSSVVTYLQKSKVIPVETFEKPWMGTIDKYVTTVIDISEFKLIKGRALLCHETQSEDVDRVISFPGNPVVEQEYFILRMAGIHEVFMGKTDRVANSLLEENPSN